MAYLIEWETEASTNFDLLDNSVKININKYLKKLVSIENPKVFGKQLTGDLTGYWSYRVGNYRIIVDIQDDKLIILIIAIDHRRKVYKKNR